MLIGPTPAFPLSAPPAGFGARRVPILFSNLDYASPSSHPPKDFSSEGEVTFLRGHPKMCALLLRIAEIYSLVCYPDEVAGTPPPLNVTFLGWTY